LGAINRIAHGPICNFHFAKPLAKRRRQAFPNGKDPALKTQIGEINRINASQFAIFILHFSFCNSLS
jgi:hypothetical protein